MNSRNKSVILTESFFLIVAGAVLVTFVVNPESLSADFAMRLAIGSAAILSLIGVLVTNAGYRSRQRRELLRSVDTVCSLDLDATNSQPVHDFDGPWSDVLNRIRQSLDGCRERLLEAEHLRASTEIRVHRLSSQYEQMAEIVAGLSDPVVVFDHFDELILANRSAQDLFDLEETPTEKGALNQLVACEELIELLTETQRRKLPAQRTGEVSISTDGSDTSHYRVTCTGIPMSSGNDSKSSDDSHGVVAVLNDISHEKAVQQRNAEFVSAVSHEMKTPLAGIKAYVELLADGEVEDEETKNEFLDIIDGQADRLKRLVDNLLNLARMEAGVVEVKKETQSLNEVLEQAIEVVQPSAEQKEIALDCDLSPMYLAVLADSDMLLQSAINLLSNAIKYTPDGGTVTMRSKMHDNKAIFEVEDTGVGLSEEDSRRIFEKFYRVKKDQNMAGGTGLGLPLARHIIEDVHGGQLSADSQLDEGSIFRVTLPCISSHVYGMTPNN